MSIHRLIRLTPETTSLDVDRDSRPFSIFTLVGRGTCPHTAVLFPYTRVGPDVGARHY